MRHPLYSASWMLVTCLLAVGALPRVAHAQDEFQRSLRAAVQLYEELEYEQALEQLQRARRLALGDEQEVTVALYEGIILGDMRQRDQSRAAFKKGLRLNPEAKLPLKVSPKLESDFEEVRAEVLAEPRTPGPSAQPAVAGTDQPKQPELDVPVSMPPPYTPTVEGQVRRRAPVAPLVLAGVGVAAVGVGAVFGLQSRASVSDARSAVFQDETRAHLDEARGSARMANVLFGTAGLAATGALVTWLLSSDGSPAPASKEER